MKSSLLLGNGLNRLAGAMELAGLMHSLAGDKRQNHRKTFGDVSSWPLAFERIYSERNKNYAEEAVSKSELKKQLGDCIEKSVSTVKDWPLLSEFTNLPVKHILTTNYDYNLEKAVNPKFRREKSPEKTKEKLYSLYRKITPSGQFLREADKVVWHIHGEIEASESICLGFEHYCAQMGAMRHFLTKPHEKLPGGPYINRFLEKPTGALEREADSWLTLFFTHHIYIIGLSLSLMEIDLWWLLTYRLQYQLRHPKITKNKIVYFCPASQEPEAEILELMSALGLEVRALGLGTKGDDREKWMAFYRRVFNSIKSDLNEQTDGAD